METDLVADALRMAIDARSRGPGLGVVPTDLADRVHHRMKPPGRVWSC